MRRVLTLFIPTDKVRPGLFPIPEAPNVTQTRSGVRVHVDFGRGHELENRRCCTYRRFCTDGQRWRTIAADALEKRWRATTADAVEELWRTFAADAVEEWRSTIAANALAVVLAKAE